MQGELRCDHVDRIAGSMIGSVHTTWIVPSAPLANCSVRAIVSGSSLGQAGLGDAAQAGRRLDARDRTAECELQVDVVARELEQLSAAEPGLHEPRLMARLGRRDLLEAPGLGRAERATDQHGERGGAQELADPIEEVDATPLEADGADGLARLPRGDDGPRVVEAASERLLEVHVHPARERGDRRLAVRERRRAHEQGVGALRVEQLLPAAVGLTAGDRACLARPLDLRIADARHLEPGYLAHRLQVAQRDRTRADEGNPHR